MSAIFLDLTRPHKNHMRKKEDFFYFISGTKNEIYFPFNWWILLGTGCLKKIQFYPEKIPQFLSRFF